MEPGPTCYSNCQATSPLAFACCPAAYEDTTAGCIGVEGFTDVQLGVSGDAAGGEDDPIDFGQYGIFRLVPQQMYGKMKQLRSFDSQVGTHADSTIAERQSLLKEVHSSTARSRVPPVEHLSRL